MIPPEIQQRLADVREYMRNPSAYCDYHSTTREGMIQYSLEIDRLIANALDAAEASRAAAKGGGV